MTPWTTPRDFIGYLTPHWDHPDCKPHKVMLISVMQQLETYMTHAMVNEEKQVAQLVNSFI